MSASTEALVGAIRSRLLTYVPSTTTTLTTLLGSRLYYDQAPAAGSVSPKYPYATYRLINRLETDGFGGMRETGDVEVLFFGRPRGASTGLWAVERCADVADEALLSWHETSAGLTFSRHRLRDTLPLPLDGMDRDLVTLRCVYPVAFWPTYRTTHA